MKIGVVIPTLNEAERLPQRIVELRAQPEIGQIVVVDGRSADGATDVARRLGLEALVTAPGRGQQVAEGAAAINQDVILFLHADTTIPPRRGRGDCAVSRVAAGRRRRQFPAQV
ncbi:MAG: glycosyltransferase [Alphaproteobacteria bacterium]|nr:glycosyltransferase [Alphaproteobacteria bacterium]